VDAKNKWNQKYKDRLLSNNPPATNRRLLDLSAYLNGRSAIDFASGLGGNSIYLAELGYDVTAIDISDVAISYLREQAAVRNLPISAKLADLTKESTDLTNNQYDLAVMTYYLDRSLLPYIKQTINTDGYLFFETYYENGTNKNQHISSRYKLESNELLKEFGDWKILFFEENEQEGRQTIFCRKGVDSNII
jgi:tellurite methyltransferase